MSSHSRVLVVGSDPTRLHALSGFLAVRGYVVDHATDETEARALLDHLEYYAVVAHVGMSEEADLRWGVLLRELRFRGRVTRVVALVPAISAGSPARAWLEADLVLAEDHSIVQLAEAVCDSLAA